MTEALTVQTEKHVAVDYRRATEAAALCKEIVNKTVLTIAKRQYVRVEGWQAIATAHGCVGSARDVERVDGGVRAIGEVRRMSDGAVIATAEGFVGDDESTWSSRQEYAKRAMAQTRAISRACRSAFAHVVVMINEKLETTPAEEAEGAPGLDPIRDPSAKPHKPADTHQPEDGEVVKVDVEAAGTKDGGTEKNPWTRYWIKGTDGAYYSSFDKKIGAVLLESKGASITLRIKRGDKGNDVLAIVTE